MAQADCITTAIRQLMSRGRPPKSTSPVRAAHTELVAALAANAPRRLHSEANSKDLEGRADHLERVFAALHVYLAAIIAETAQDIPASNLDRRYLDSLFQQFSADAMGAIRGRNAWAKELEGLMTLPPSQHPGQANRRYFIGGSDARIIMGTDETALARLWREKRGEAGPPDYSDNLIVQLGVATEPLNRRWYEKTTGLAIKDVQRWIRHPVVRWMAATLDGTVKGSGAIFEAKFMLPWSFSEEAAAEKHMAQVQHNMWVANATEAVLSIVTGGGKWVEITISADPLYQHLLLTAEKKFWRCIESGEPPRLFGVEPPRARIEAVRTVDMSSSNAWAEFSSVFRRTHEAHGEHEKAKAELKGLMPQDAKEAVGHGIRAKRSKSGAVSFDLLSMEGSAHAPVQ